MSEALAELIRRMEVVLTDYDSATLWLNWSDIETLKAVQLELADDDARIQRLRDTVSSALDVALNGAGQ